MEEPETCEDRIGTGAALSSADKSSSPVNSVQVACKLRVSPTLLCGMLFFSSSASTALVLNGANEATGLRVSLTQKDFHVRWRPPRSLWQVERERERDRERENQEDGGRSADERDACLARKHPKISLGGPAAC